MGEIMARTRIAEALRAQAAMSEIVVCGWVRTRRDAKGFTFLELNDGSCLANLQIILDEGTPAWDKLEGVNTGASLRVTGALVESPGKGQAWELRAGDMEVYGLADPESFPLQKKRHSDEFLRGIAHLRARTNKYGAAFRVRSEAALAVHDFFRANGFYYVHTPILTGADAEGAGEMFQVTTLSLCPPYGAEPLPPEKLFEHYATLLYNLPCLIRNCDVLELVYHSNPHAY